jgi:putative ABC transport system permease protein
MHDVIGDDSPLQLALGLVFLGVCVLNTLGLTLAKSLSAASISGLRRALGARRIDIIRQHVIEVVVVCLLGGAFGVSLTAGGLAVLLESTRCRGCPCTTSLVACCCCGSWG